MIIARLLVAVTNGWLWTSETDAMEKFVHQQLFLNALAMNDLYAVIFRCRSFWSLPETWWGAQAIPTTLVAVFLPKRKGPSEQRVFKAIRGVVSVVVVVQSGPVLEHEILLEACWQEWKPEASNNPPYVSLFNSVFFSHRFFCRLPTMTT